MGVRAIAGRFGSGSRFPCRAAGRIGQRSRRATLERGQLAAGLVVRQVP